MVFLRPVKTPSEQSTPKMILQHHDEHGCLCSWVTVAIADQLDYEPTHSEQEYTLSVAEPKKKKKTLIILGAPPKLQWGIILQYQSSKPLYQINPSTRQKQSPATAVAVIESGSKSSCKTEATDAFNKEQFIFGSSAVLMLYKNKDIQRAICFCCEMVNARLLLTKCSLRH